MQRQWTTKQVEVLRTERNVMIAAIKTGRSPRAVYEKATREGIAPPAQSHARYWCKSTVKRALQRRKEGWSVARISGAMGVPVGTLRHWIYDRKKS